MIIALRQIVPYDYHLFGPLKEELGGQYDADVEEFVRNKLQTQPIIFYKNRIAKQPIRCQNVLMQQGTM